MSPKQPPTIPQKPRLLTGRVNEISREHYSHKLIVVRDALLLVSLRVCSLCL